MTDTPFISPDFSSAEAQRLWYLRQLGVSSYYPRFVLPGALPSQACELPPVDLPPAPVAERQAHSTDRAQQATPLAPEPARAGSGSAGGVHRVLQEVDKVDAMPAATGSRSTQTKAVSEAPATADAPRFRVLLLRAERGLAVCNQVPLQGGEALGAQEQRLLQNILAWMGSPLVAGRPRLFVWPPRGLDAGGSDAAEVAARSLFGFLEQAQQEQGFTRLLLMGSSAPELLHSWQQSRDRALPWQAFRTHSLGEMMAQPLLKREAWQALQPLHHLLQSR